MENTPTPIATPAQRQALRRNQQQRLRDQAEALLRAVEAMEPPKTYAEAERAAKAMMAVGKVLDAVNVETRDDLRTREIWDKAPDPELEHEALTSWKAILDHSLETLAATRLKARDLALGDESQKP